MSSLKHKTVSGLSWSFVDTMAGQGISFIVGIILARLLTPEEFGLIGMITIFIAISTSFIDSGFRNALIRKKDCTQKDYSTVFFFNLSVGILFFLILFFSAGAISRFFEEPQLLPLVRVLGLTLIIDSLTIIQRTILIKRIDFKLQAKISLIAAIGSGIIAIWLAYRGFGVWALVAQRLINQALNSLFLWLWNQWIPHLIFSIQSFKELFGFGSKLLISGLIDTAYRNIYYLVIGKFFSAETLGYYTRADSFKQLPANNLLSIISRVTYPVLSSIQEDIPRLRRTYQQMIRTIMFFTFTLILGMGAVAEPMIYTLIGPQWAPAILYLQILVFQGMMYPLQALNLNMLQVQGRSDLFLYLEIIKKVLAVPIIIIGIAWGIKWMLIGMVINSQIAYYLNSYWSGRSIGYSYQQQIVDILPSFFMALSMAVLVYIQGLFLPFSHPVNLIIQIISGAIYIILFSEIIRFRDYISLKKLILEKLNSTVKRK